MVSCAIPGHRPQKFPFGYDESDRRCVVLKANLHREIARRIMDGCVDFYAGAALGVDTWFMESVLKFRRVVDGITLTAVLPCATQADRWPPAAQARYHELLDRCDRVLLLQEAYTRDCMLSRDRYLVDHTDCLIAVYDGSDTGGTAYTVRYARSVGKPLYIIDPAQAYDTFLLPDSR